MRGRGEREKKERERERQRCNTSPCSVAAWASVFICGCFHIPTSPYGINFLSSIVDDAVRAISK